MKRLIAVLTDGLDLHQVKLLDKDSKFADIHVENLNTLESRKGYHWYIDQIDDPTGHHENERS